MAASTMNHSLQSMVASSQQLPNTLLEGYQPVDRQNEQVQNCWVDTMEYNKLCVAPDGQVLQTREVYTDTLGAKVEEGPPAFHDWASVTPGTILVREKRAQTRFKQQMAAETACPVLACASCKGQDDDDLYFFAGVARTPSVREYDDGKGPSMDEMFTMFIGGKATILNNGNAAIHPGDLVEWTFFELLTGPGNASSSVNGHVRPRRIQVRSITSEAGTHSTARVIGKALTFAKKGELLDILIAQ